MKKKFQRHPPESISQMLHSAHFLHILLHTAHIRACAFQSKITSSLFFSFLFFLKKKNRGVVLMCHFRASLKHKDDGQTKFIKPNSQRQDIIIKYWVSIGSIHREQG